ncbi:MAG: exodeoxyribonuclease V gamma [Desulfobulbaceae bacterium]|nr:MAG: exodeoxyribonuclease V gamma [Desulfobulbaceae bacterium]
MFYLHLSNRTENLLARLVDILRHEPRRDLFAREIFLIQSQGMERMLSQRLADALPVWCNFDYMLPTRFFDHMAARLGLMINPDAYNREAMAWRIDAQLHAMVRQTQGDGQGPFPSVVLPTFAPLLRYLSGEQSALKRYQLARQLADCFDQYQIMRPEMLAGWQVGKTSTTNPAELWQMAIWKQLRDSLEQSPHRGELLHLFLESLHGQEDVSEFLPSVARAPSLTSATLGVSASLRLPGHPWPARLSIFGLHSMPPLLLDCLAGLSRHCDVHLYLLSPCQNHWADIPGKRQLIRESLARLKNGQEAADIDPEVHPLLNALGRQGRDFQTMLLERVDELIDTDSFEDPMQSGSALNFSHSSMAHNPASGSRLEGVSDFTDSATPCLLHRLQSDLLDGGWTGTHPTEPMPLDSSLTMVSCHSPVREIMVLKDQILRWLQDNPDMALRDIVVMAPDIQEYAAIIPAIFHDIQHSIADRSLRHRNQVLNIFFQFLDLAVSRCSWSGVLDLLEAPEIAATFGNLSESDIELIRHWVTSAGIRWGLSTDQLSTLGLITPAPDAAPPMAEITWRAGLDRLLLGYAMDWEAPVDGILPYPDIEGSMARPLGGLCQFVELLTQTAEALGRPRPLAAWSTLLQAQADALFGPEMNDDVARLRQILSDLALRFGSFHQHDVPIEVIRAWLDSTASESRSSAGFLRGQLTFCSMLPMRSIPFRAVCLLGLNDGVFPKTDRQQPFNLLTEEFRPGDRSRRNDDRYQFLEALLSARQSLYLSHVGQSIHTGSAIPPSVLISELVETLRLAYAIVDPVVKHPLQPFSPRYFDGSGLESYNHHNCTVAAALSHPPSPPDSPVPWWTGTLPGDDREAVSRSGVSDTVTVNIASLLSFFAHPQKWFVHHRLEIRLDTDTELPDETEPFSSGWLDSYLVNQELVQSCLDDADDDQDPGTILARLQAQGRWMLGAPGRLAFDGLIPELMTFAGAIQALDMGDKLADLPIDLTFEGVRLMGQLGGIHENGILLARYSGCKGKDLLRAWIHHLLAAAAHPERPGRTHLLSKDQALTFAPLADPVAHLSQLLVIYRQGAASPSPLLVEPAWAYLQQETKARATTSPLQAAQTVLRNSLEKGQEPELALLYGDIDPAALLGPEFEQLCETFVSPILAAGKDKS